MNNIIETDIDGYPTDEALSIIENWSHKDHYLELMEFIADYFNSGYGRCEYRDIDNTWEVVTGGWSGNEEIISALKKNTMFWLTCWKISKRGGYYEFDRTDIK